MEIRIPGYPRPETPEEWAKLICQRCQFLGDFSSENWDLIPEESRSARAWASSHLFTWFKAPVICFQIFKAQEGRVCVFEFLVYRQATRYSDDIVVAIKQVENRSWEVHIVALDIEHWRK